MIKGIIFDVGGVLVSDGIRHYVLTAAAAYYHVSPRRMREALKNHDDAVDRTGWNEKAFWHAVAKDLRLRNPPPPRKIWTEQYAAVARPHTDVLALVRRLHKKYRLAVLSNTIPPHVEANRKRGIYRFFGVRIFSCDPAVNAKKPRRKIYEACLRLMGLPPEECVFIDNARKNLVPAQRLGMHTILYQNPAQLMDELAAIGVRWQPL